MFILESGFQLDSNGDLLSCHLYDKFKISRGFMTFYGERSMLKKWVCLCCVDFLNDLSATTLIWLEMKLTNK